MWTICGHPYVPSLSSGVLYVANNDSNGGGVGSLFGVPRRRDLLADGFQLAPTVLADDRRLFDVFGTERALTNIGSECLGPTQPFPVPLASSPGPRMCFCRHFASVLAPRNLEIRCDSVSADNYHWRR